MAIIGKAPWAGNSALLFRCGRVSTRRESGDNRTETTRWFSYMGKLILGFENPPWDVLYRVVIGYSIIPVTVHLVGQSPAALQLLAVFLAVLVSLRIIPGVLRRVLPFPREVKNAWAERRAVAKRYDSYQWRKLFGIGLGWVGHLVISGKTVGTPILMAGACLSAGAVGFACWKRVSRPVAAQASSSVAG